MIIYKGVGRENNKGEALQKEATLGTITTPRPDAARGRAGNRTQKEQLQPWSPPGRSCGLPSNLAGRELGEYIPELLSLPPT